VLFCFVSRLKCYGISNFLWEQGVVREEMIIEGSKILSRL